MSIEDIAKKCHTKISANDGFFHEEYFVGCIMEAIGEALAAQQSVQPTPPTEPQNFCNPVNGVHASWCTGHNTAGG